MKKNGDSFQAVTHLQALEWLKATTPNNERVEDHISLDKMKIIQKTAESVQVYLEDEEVGSPVGQQRDLLRIMSENHFNEADIKQMREAFQTGNVLDKQKITKLTRKIVKAKRDSEPYLDMLNELIKLSYRTFASKAEKQKYDHTGQVLFYVKDNE